MQGQPGLQPLPTLPVDVPRVSLGGSFRELRMLRGSAVPRAKGSGEPGRAEAVSFLVRQERIGHVPWSLTSPLETLP